MATPHFPRATLEQMKKQDISESTATDTFNSGEYHSTSTGSHMMEKRYESSGYLIWLLYVTDNSTGRHVIVSIKKRKII